MPEGTLTPTPLEALQAQVERQLGQTTPATFPVEAPTARTRITFDHQPDVACRPAATLSTSARKLTG